MVRRAKISSLGTYLPPRVMTNSDFEKIVETSDEWIVERTGIRERHIVSDGMALSDMAAEAAKVCLAKRGLAATEVEVIRYAGHDVPFHRLPGAGQDWCHRCLGL